MSKTIRAAELLEIQYKGEFFYEMLYKVMYFWCIDNGFIDEQDGSDKIEHLYSEVVLPGGGAKEVWHWWRVIRKESDFFTYRIRLNVHILGMTEGEKIVEGKKVKTNNLEADIFFESFVDMAEGKLDIEKHSLLKSFKNFFYYTIIQHRIKDRKTHLYNITHDLINTVKQHLGLQMDVSLSKPFHNPHGVPQFS
jgi:hypothetical protein